MHKTKITIYLAIIFFGFFGGAGVASAAEYYVSPTGIVAWTNCSGSTPLNGTLACSWQTAMANAVAGDTVYFRGGTYDLGIFANHPSMAYAKMYPANSGTAGNPITFAAYPGEMPIITGTVVATSQEAWFGCGSADDQNGTNSYITWDGFSATLKVNNINPATGVYDNTYINPSHYETTIFRTGGDYCTIRNSNFTGVDVGSWPYNTSFVRLESGSYALIENNYFHDLAGAGINTTALWTFAAQATDNVIRNNTVFNSVNGFLAKLGPHIRNKYYNNFVYNTYYSGIRITNQSAISDEGIEIYKNIIVDNYNGSSYCGIDIMGTSDTLLARNHQIYNNTIYGATGCGMSTNGANRGQQFWNNIVYGKPSSFVRYYTGDSLPAYSNYNNFYNSGASIWNLNWATNYTTILSWRTATSLDTNSVTTNPNFINAGGSLVTDYKRSSYPTDGRGGAYASVMGAYITGDEVIGYVAPNQCRHHPALCADGTRRHLMTVGGVGGRMKICSSSICILQNSGNILVKFDKIRAIDYTQLIMNNTKHIYFKREDDKNISKAFENWRVVLLFGARQVGKTTMADKYFDSIKVSKKKILGQNKDVQKLLGDSSLSSINYLIGDAKFLFIDEAQYIEDIGTVLKLIYDTKPDVKVLATGSSAFGLASKTSEAMTGRKISLSAFPLSVREVMHNDIFDDVAFNTAQILKYGTYPKVLSVNNINQKQEILIELADAYLYKDILEFHGIRKAPVVAKLAKMLALQVGNQVSLSELARSLEINKATVQNYIDILVKSFIIFPLTTLSRNPRKELNKSMKYYFYDNGIRNAIIRNFSDFDIRNDVGAMWENFIVSEMYKRYTYDKKSFNMYHWRTYDQKEIDIVIEENGILSAYECKYAGGSKDVNKATHNLWNSLYPNTKIEVINKNNFVSYLK